jgi:hypothetical protein
VTRRRALAVVLASAAVLMAGLPESAEAHGPVAPVALDYLARVSRVPAGVEAKVVDGDQRMWLRVLQNETVIVLDYRGAPYLRSSPAGLAVNQNSAMYYLNQTPVALTPPPGLGPRTPPRWRRVSGGSAYQWHDGRLHALATVALRPGSSYVGRWTVPIVVDGHASVISGGLWHADPPSLVWFWPIVVLLSCALAVWRVRRPRLDLWTARVLGVIALAAVAAAGVGRQLHGRPDVSVFQLVVLGLILAFVVWGLVRLIFQRPGFFSYLLIAIVALWQGLELIPTLLNGFVLIAIPPFVARAATVLALGCALGLVPLMFGLSDLQTESEREAADAPVEGPRQEDDAAWELA